MSSAIQTGATPSTPRSAFDFLRLGAYPLFFASGMAALVYEIVWTRLLLYVFGAGIYAVTAVLAAFMAGLAIGSFCLGRFADRLRRPLAFYALLEFFIALAGLLLPAALDRIDLIDGWAYGRWGQRFAVLTASRFTVSFALMLVPTTLMGATLPVLAKAMVRRSRTLGLHIGALYAVNTAGAVAGTFLAGFYFIERFGVANTEFIAVGLNLFAAAGALALARSVGRLPTEPGAEPPEPPIPAAGLSADRFTASAGLASSQIRLILFAAFLTGLVSLAAQVLWFRSLVFAFEYLKNTTYAFSAMLTIFLLGLALGSAVIGLVVDRHLNPMRLYGMLLVLLGGSIAFSVTFLYTRAGFVGAWIGDPFDPALQQMNWPRAVATIMGQSAAVLGVPTLLMGMAFPVAVRAVVSVRHVGGQTGGLYALNTAGAIVGSLLACFAIVPFVGLTRGLLVLAAADALLGLAVLACAPASRAHAIGFTVFALAIFGAVVAFLPRDGVLQQLIPGESLLFYKEGPLATVSVIENNFGYRTIYVDGVGVAGTEPMLQTDQKSLAHVPMAFVENPRSALTVGFGSGGASYSYLLHNRLERVDCIEICETVMQAAPLLTAANHNVLNLDDDRYRVILDDARTYLQYTEQTYDIIATDCTDLRYKSNANLYDLEYFQFCREALNPGGVVVVWMPLGGLSLEMFKVALRTFHRVFGRMAVFYMNNEPTHYILLLGWRDEMQFDFERMTQRMAEPDVRADLAEIHLESPTKLLSTFITGGEALEDYLAGDAINTQDRPRLEFESPKYGYRDQPILDNLASLMAIRRSPLQWLSEAGIAPEPRAELERHEAALPHIVAGHAHYRKLEIEESAKSYLTALELSPSDRSLENLLGFREVRLMARRNNPWAWLMLGRVYQLRDMREQAIDSFDQVRRIIDPAAAAQDEFAAGMLRNARRWQSELEPPTPADEEP